MVDVKFSDEVKNFMLHVFVHVLHSVDLWNKKKRLTMKFCDEHSIVRKIQLKTTNF